MHRSEEVLYECCASCGTEVLPNERMFVFESDADERAVLCFDCGVARGGLYDEPHDRWTQAPDVADLISRGD